MNIAKGQPWGTQAVPPKDVVTVKGDSEARAIVEQDRRCGSTRPVLLQGGDLCRTLGGGPGRGRDEGLRTRADVDVGSVLVDGRLYRFVAHLVARRSWLRGNLLVIMNASWMGRWLAGPRAHPGDGLLDVTQGDLPLGQRWEAGRRARTGTHLPHPALRTSRVSAAQFDLEPQLDIWLDGERVEKGASRLSVRVEPASLRVFV